MQNRGDIAADSAVDNEKEHSEGIKDISKDFLSSSTLHGVNKLDPSGTPLYRRGLWFCFILGSTAYMIYTVIEELNHFYTYPTTTTVKVEQENELRLPAVTICNLSPNKMSAQYNNDSRFHAFLIESLGWAQNLVNWSDPYYQDDFYQKPQTAKYFFDTSFTVDEVFFSCKLDVVPFNCSNYIDRIMTDVGPCFIFNKDGRVKTARNGANYNFLFGFNIHQDDYFFGFLDGSGIKFAIHEPGQRPDIYTDGFLVHPGAVAYAAIDRKMYKYLPHPYKAFRNKYCIDTESKDFKNPNKFSNYTPQSCFSECMSDIVLKYAGCVLPTHFGNGPYCAFANHSNYYAAVVRAYFDANTMNMCKGKCLPSCKWVEFDTKLSYADFPSHFRSKMPFNILPSGKNYSYEYYRQNILTLNVFYEKLTTTHFETVPVYSSVGDVLAKIGGQMGLFIGASILTLTELLEFCCRLFYQILCKKRTTLNPKPAQH